MSIQTEPSLQDGTSYTYSVNSDSEFEAKGIKVDEGVNAKRYNRGKPRMELLPLWLFPALAEHYEQGANKYEDWNWIKGGDTDVCFGALLRHLAEWQSGQDIDPETSTHHMLAVAWNALTLYHGWRSGVDNDKRPDLELHK